MTEARIYDITTRKEVMSEQRKTEVRETMAQIALIDVEVDVLLARKSRLLAHMRGENT